jgi:hypothetical protein
MPDTERRFKDLEDDMREVCKDVKEILTNHLPHINTKIAVLIAQMVIVLAGLAYLIFR